MPSRIIREGWLDSPRIALLDVHAERFFLRLCLRADDFGRYHASPTLLKSYLFPLSEEIRSTDIPRWLAACETAGLVRCYEVLGKPVLEIPRFEQRTRAKTSKFPAPDGSLPHVRHMSDISPAHVGHMRTESESESESELAPDKPSRSGNVLADALALACGSDPAQMTRREIGACQMALAAIQEATPSADKSEFEGRANAYRRKYRGVALTPQALSSHWGELTPIESRRPEPSMPEPPDWRRKLTQAGLPHLADPRPWKDMAKHTQRTVLQALEASEATPGKESIP